MSDKSLFKNENLLKKVKLINLKYTSWLGERFFEIKAYQEEAAVFVDVTLMNSAQTFFYPVSSKMAIEEQNLSADDACDFLYQYIDSYFEDYFDQDEGLWLPIDWKEYDLEGTKFFLKGQVQNKYVDNLADRLLAGESISEKEVAGLKLTRD